MRQAPLTNPYKLSVNVRPVKVAYFVANNIAQMLENLVPLICTQWGGIRHLIIVLEKDYSISLLDQSILKIHEPDLFALYGSFDKSESANFQQQSQENIVYNTLQEQLQKILPNRHFVIQHYTVFEKYDRTAHALSVISDAIAKSKTLILPSITDGSLDLLSLILFGQIYSGQQEDYHSFLTTSGRQVKYGSEEFWLSQMEMDPFSSILNLTSHQISAYSVAGGWSDSFDHFDLVICDLPSDYVLFWNVRALRESSRFLPDENGIRRTICLPIDLLEQADKINILFELISQKLFKPGRTANLDIRFHCSSSEITNKVKTVLQNYKQLIPFTEQTIRGNDIFSAKRHEIQQPVERRLLTYLFNIIGGPTRYLETVSRSLPFSININYGENEIRFEPPDKFFNRYGGEVAVDFECDIWNRYPKTQALASKIISNSWFSKYGISSIMMLVHRPTFIRFNLPDEREALQIYFRSKGYELTESRISQYSNALIDLVGGLQGISVIASKNCYQLLDALAVKSTKKVAQRIVKELKLPETTAEEILRIFATLELPEEIKDIPRTSSQMVSNPQIGLSKGSLFELLDRLISCRILRRGFYLDCPNCGNAEWYPLSQLDEFLVCPGCGTNFVLPVHESRGQEDIRWRYRLNTTVNRAIDQDVLVGVLAIYYLTKEKPLSCFGFGLQLIKDGKQISDIDFIFVSNSEIYAGECKSGTRLGKKDFENARTIILLGVSAFYFVTTQKFDSQTCIEIENFRKSLQEDGLLTPVITLSETELLEVSY